MKKQFFFSLHFCLALTLSLGACELFKKSPEEILTTYSWELSLLRVDSNCDSIYDITHTPEDCNADDLLIFEADGTLMYDDGNWLCNAADAPNSTVGYWSLISDNTTLLIEYLPGWGGMPEVLEIETLSEDEFIVTGSDFISPPCAKGKFTFSAQ